MSEPCAETQGNAFLMTESPQYINLICLPYAGGAFSFFKPWEERLGASIRLLPVELSGHGVRFDEPLYDSVDEAVTDLFSILEADIRSGVPYAMFGHSLGTLLAYELVKFLEQKALPPPLHVFFSGRATPDTEDNSLELSKKNDGFFIQEIKNYDDLPRELLQYPQLLKYYLPVIRSDLKLVGTYRAVQPIAKAIPCNISVLFGHKDSNYQKEDVEKWKNVTEKGCSFHYFDGGHFFIGTHTTEVVKIINATLHKARLNESE